MAMSATRVAASISDKTREKFAVMLRMLKAIGSVSASPANEVTIAITVPTLRSSLF